MSSALVRVIVVVLAVATVSAGIATVALSGVGA